MANERAIFADKYGDKVEVMCISDSIFLCVTDGTRVTCEADLTPETAREIAAALIKFADEVCPLESSTPHG